MNIKKIDFSEVKNAYSHEDNAWTKKEAIKIDDNSMVVVIKWNAKIFNNNEFEAIRNVFLVDKEGNVIWRVTSKDDDTPYFGYFLSANYYKDSGRLTAYRRGGFLCDIDIKTGIVTKSVFTK
jgi:hypothetical protein